MKTKFKQLKKETEKLLEEMGGVENNEVFGLKQFKLKGKFNNFEYSIDIEHGLFTIFGRFDKQPFDKWTGSKFNFHKTRLSIDDVETYLSIVDDILNLENPPYIYKNNI